MSEDLDIKQLKDQMADDRELIADAKRELDIMAAERRAAGIVDSLEPTPPQPTYTPEPTTRIDADEHISEMDKQRPAAQPIEPKPDPLMAVTDEHAVPQEVVSGPGRMRRGLNVVGRGIKGIKNRIPFINRRSNSPVIPPDPTTPDQRAPLEFAKTLDGAREAYANEYTHLVAQSKRDIGVTGRLKLALKGREMMISPELKALEEHYDKMAAAEGQRLFDEKKAAVEASTLSKKDQEAELARYKQNEIFTKVIVEEQAKLNELKVGNLPPKERAAIIKGLSKGFEWYMKQSRPKRMLMTTAVSVALVAGTTGGSVLALSAFAAKKVARSVVGSAVGQSAARLFDYTLGYKFSAKAKAAGEKLEEEFAKEDFSTSITKSKKAFEKIEKQRKNAEIQRLVTKGFITMVAGIGTSVELGHLMSGGVVSAATEQHATEPHVTPPPQSGDGSPEELLKKLGLSHEKVGDIKMPDPNDHSPQAEEIRRAYAALGLHEKQIDPIGAAIQKAEAAHKIEVNNALNLPPDASHSIVNNFSWKPGEGTSISNEAIFRQLAASHMALSGTTLDEKSATEILNVGANLARLAEHHNTAGVSVEDFEKAFIINDGKFEGIKDYALANEILGKFETHFDKIWGEGIPQGAGAAISEIPNLDNDTWIHTVHADSLHQGLDANGGHIDTGIVGHQNITGTVDFKNSDLVKHAQIVENAKTLTPEQALAGVQENASKVAVDTYGFDQRGQNISIVNENINNNSGGVTASEHITRGVMDNPYNLTDEMVKQVNTTYENNLHLLYPNNSDEIWAGIKDTGAHDLLTATESTLNPNDLPLFHFLQRIEEVTGIKPLEQTLLNPRPESISEFIRRGLQTAASFPNGKESLDLLDLNK